MLTSSSVESLTNISVVCNNPDSNYLDCYAWYNKVYVLVLIIFLNFLELFNDKSNTHEFVNLVKELALPGELTQSRSYDFEFMQVEKPYESYIGANVRLRYETKGHILYL